MAHPRPTKNGNAAIEFGKLPQYIGYQLRQAQTIVFRDIARSIRSIGVTPGEFSLLSLLNSNPGINSITLASHYRLDKATLSLSIKRLAERGLIESERDEDDRRYYALRLSDTGRRKLRALTRLIEKQERMIDSVLRKGERQMVLDLLSRITEVFRGSARRSDR